MKHFYACRKCTKFRNRFCSISFLRIRNRSWHRSSFTTSCTSTTSSVKMPFFRLSPLPFCQTAHPLPTLVFGMSREREQGWLTPWEMELVHWCDNNHGLLLVGNANNESLSLCSFQISLLGAFSLSLSLSLSLSRFQTIKLISFPHFRWLKSFI